MNSDPQNVSYEETELLEGLRKGDPEALSRAYEAHGAMVFRAAYSVTGNRDTALDVAQGVFLELLRKISTFQGRSSLKTWLYRVAYNAALDARRKKFPEPLPPGVEGLPDGSDPLAETQRTQWMEKLQGLLGLLSDREKKAFLMKNQEGLGFDEIAAILECKPGAVEDLLFRAHRKLRKKLDRDGL